MLSGVQFFLAPVSRISHSILHHFLKTAENYAIGYIKTGIGMIVLS